MNTIKNVLMFTFIVTTMVVIVNIFFRFINLLVDQTIMLDKDSSAVAVVIGTIAGVIMAIGHFYTEDEE